MSPSEVAALLLVTVRRHLRSLALTLDPDFPWEDWGFLAQQALEKVLQASIVLADREPPLTHELAALATLAEIALTPMLLALQPFAVKARTSALEARPRCDDLIALHTSPDTCQLSF